MKNDVIKLARWKLVWPFSRGDTREVQGTSSLLDLYTRRSWQWGMGQWIVHVFGGYTRPDTDWQRTAVTSNTYPEEFHFLADWLVCWLAG